MSTHTPSLDNAATPSAIVLRRFRVVFNAVRSHFKQIEKQVQPLAQALLAQVPGPFEGVLPVALDMLPSQTLTQLDGNLAELIALLQVDESAGIIPLAQL